jgi:hypothetical protein
VAGNLNICLVHEPRRTFVFHVALQALPDFRTVLSVAAKKGAIMAGKKGPVGGYATDVKYVTCTTGMRLGCPTATRRYCRGAKGLPMVSELGLEVK